MSATLTTTEYVKDKTGFVYVKHAGMEDLLERGELQICDAPAPPEAVDTVETAAPTAPARPQRRTAASAQSDTATE
jgi:hypothetical protein